MDHIMLILFGLAMRADETGAKLDTRHSALIFGRFKETMERQFGEGGAVGMKNMLNISLPNFFKNLLFAGGPRINPGIVEIESQDVFDSIVDEFNNDFRDFGVLVEKSQIYDECCDRLNRLSAGTLPTRLSWLVDVCQYRKQRRY
jgi:hypothetical protein